MKSVQPAKPGYYLVPKEDVNQSTIRITHGHDKKQSRLLPHRRIQQASAGNLLATVRDIRTTNGLANRWAEAFALASSSRHPAMSIGTKSPTTIESIQATRGHRRSQTKARSPTMDQVQE